jgi:hypothetical protein
MTNDKSHVTVFTKNFRIDGEIDLIPRARLTDYMNETKKFMVVTNATVADHTGRELSKGQFLNVSVENIEIVLPSDRLG